MLLLIFLTTNSLIKCCNYEVFTDFVWPLNFHYEKQQPWRIKGGAEWAKARSPHHLSTPNPKIICFSPSSSLEIGPLSKFQPRATSNFNLTLNSSDF